MQTAWGNICIIDSTILKNYACVDWFKMWQITCIKIFAEFSILGSEYAPARQEINLDLENAKQITGKTSAEETPTFWIICQADIPYQTKELCDQARAGSHHTVHFSHVKYVDMKLGCRHLLHHTNKQYMRYTFFGRLLAPTPRN